jgi:L-arabinose transport system substrate-binding protein
LTGGIATATAQTSRANATQAKPIEFGFIVQDGTAPFAYDQIEAAKAQAKKDGVKLLTANVQTSDSLALTTEQEFINEGAKGLIIVPPSVSIGPAILSISAKAHVPVIDDDNGPIFNAAGKATYFNGLNNVEVGQDSGMQLAQLLKARPTWNASTTAMMVDTTKAEPACNQRTTASVATFSKEVPNYKGKFVYINSDDTLTDALTSASAALELNPSVKHWLVTSCNDDGVVGVLQAMAAKGITKTTAIGWGMDGSLACTELVKSNAFYGADYVDFFGQGVSAFDEMYKYLKDGTPLPATVYLPATPITRMNYKSVAHC